MITIFTKTHRESCLDGLGIEDAATYDARIDDYFNYVLDAALEEGIAVEFDNDYLSGRSYSVTDDDYNKGHDFMMFDVKDFWEWYN